MVITTIKKMHTRRDLNVVSIIRPFNFDESGVNACLIFAILAMTRITINIFAVKLYLPVNSFSYDGQKNFDDPFVRQPSSSPSHDDSPPNFRIEYNDEKKAPRCRRFAQHLGAQFRLAEFMNLLYTSTPKEIRNKVYRLLDILEGSDGSDAESFAVKGQASFSVWVNHDERELSRVGAFGN